MVYQTNSNGYVAFKKQSALGTAANGSGSSILRLSGGQGLQLSKAVTASREVRRDGMRTKGRHGSQRVAASWEVEASIGQIEAAIEAILRDTWDVSALAITQTDFTSLVTGANSITAGGGDLRTLGLRVGDVVIPTGLPDAGNNSRNIRVSGLTSTVLTTPETLTVNASPDTSCSLTRPKKLIQYAGGALLPRYFTVEEHDIDIDQSEVAYDFVFGGIRFSMQADGIINTTISGVGTGKFDALATGASPYFTSPTEGTNAPLAVVDATIRVKGTDLVDLSSFDLALDIQPSTPAVFGSAAQKYAPDVFTGPLAASLNFTALRKDLQYLQDFKDEVQYEIHVVMAENESEPKDFISMYLGNLSLGSVVKSALSAQGGARTVQVSVPADLIGKDTRGVGYDPTMIKFQSTGA